MYIKNQNIFKRSEITLCGRHFQVLNMSLIGVKWNQNATLLRRYFQDYLPISLSTSHSYQHMKSVVQCLHQLINTMGHLLQYMKRRSFKLFSFRTDSRTSLSHCLLYSQIQCLRSNSCYYLSWDIWLTMMQRNLVWQHHHLM